MLGTFFVYTLALSLPIFKEKSSQIFLGESCKLFYILWKKSRLKSTFLPYHVKKHHSTLEMDTFKIMLLLSYLASLDNKPRT